MPTKTHLVVWGFRRKYDTFRYIHTGFAAAGQRLGWQVDWVDDESRNQKVVTPNSLVISMNLCQKYLPVVFGARYVIHNNERADLAEKITSGFGINLQTWTFNCPGDRISGQEAIRYNPPTRTLFEAWGTSIPQSQWNQPNISNNRYMFWVGSIWDNALGQGNRPVIADLVNALRNAGIRFLHLWRTPEVIHRTLIHKSGLRPAVVGNWQAENGYIPCRAFKNLSFGALPITNNRAVQVALGPSIPLSTNMESLVNDYLRMPRNEILERTSVAQENLVHFTYEANLLRFKELASS